MTTTSISGPGSFPAVISQANSTAGPQTIQFALGGTFTMASALPIITNSLTVNGRSDATVIISGGGTLPIFTLAAGTTNILSQLSLNNAVAAPGASGGGAINNSGVLYVSSCSFTNDNGRSGGAILNNAAGTATVVSTAFSGNSADYGGAIENDGTMTITGALLVQNGALNGGAVQNTGSLTMTGAQLLGGEANQGGAIYNTGTLDLQQTTVSSNVATLGLGGGLFNSGSVTMSDSTVAYNQANGGNGGYDGNAGGGGGAGLGGGFFSMSGIASLTNTTLFGNSASGGAGGGYQINALGLFGGGLNSGIDSGNSGGFSGGGAGADTGNGGTGGFGGGGGGTKTGVGGLGGFGGGSGAGPQTFGGPGGGGSGMGGAVFVQAGALTLVNCTLAANFVTGGMPGAPWTVQPCGTAGQGIGGGVFNHSATVNFINTIVAGNVLSNIWTAAEAVVANASPNSNPDLYGAFVSSGFNLVGNNQGAAGLSVNDFQNVAANLGSLQNNGGPTATCSLLPGSPAIGNAIAAGAPLTDQRGVARAAGAVDIGAFQLVTLITPTILWTNPIPIVYGTPLGPNQLDASVGANGALTYSPPASTVLQAGSNQTLNVFFTPTDPTQFSSASNSVVIQVLKAEQTIAFSPIPNQSLGSPPILLAASASSGLPVGFSLLSGPATLTGNFLTLGTDSGLVTIQASQPGDANHNLAPPVDVVFVLGTLPLPVIMTQPASQSVLPGDRVTFSVTATNGPLDFQWQFGGTNIVAANNSEFVLNNVQQNSAGSYDVVVSNPSGAITSVVASLTVNISPGTPNITTQPASQSISAGQNATFGVIATGSAPLLYQWYQGLTGDLTQPLAGATNTTLMVGAAATNTSFWVSVGNPLGVVDSGTAFLTVVPANAATLGISLVSGLPALTITGVAGSTYVVQYSPSLNPASWTQLAAVPPSTNIFTFVDSGATAGTSARFYRAVAQ